MANGAAEGKLTHHHKVNALGSGYCRVAGESSRRLKSGVYKI